MLRIAPLALLVFGVCLAPFVPAIRQYLMGQKGLQQRIARAMRQRRANASPIWMHVASVGEALQGWPLLEHWMHQGYQGVITYSSPSLKVWCDKNASFRHQNLLLLDYCPYDLFWHVRKAISQIKPRLVLYVKWDVWPNMAREIQRTGVPQILVSATLHTMSKRMQRGILQGAFRQALWQHIYGCLNAVYAASTQDAQFLKQIIPPQVPVKTLGDLRCYSTLARLAHQPRPRLPQNFCTSNPVLVAGSVWPTDTVHLLPALKRLLQVHPNVQLIWVPHQIDHPKLAYVEQQLDAFGCMRLSTWEQRAETTSKQTLPVTRVVLVDSVGKLAALYGYATLAYIGGAFGVGVHNVLEAAVASAVCLFGPNMRMDNQANALVKQGLGLVVTQQQEIYESIDHLLTHPQILAQKKTALQLWLQRQHNILPNYTLALLHWLDPKVMG